MFMRARSFAVAAVCLAAVLFVNLYFRSYPILFPQLLNEARQNVREKIFRNIAQDTEKTMPDAPEWQKAQVVDKNMREYERSQRKQIEKQVNDEFLALKDRYQDRDSRTYLMELDCWNWGRYVENVLTLGRPGDVVRNGRQIDALMLHPEGNVIAWNQFLYYFSAFLYRVFSPLHHQPLNAFLFYLPLMFSAILFTVLFLICRHTWGLTCAVISSLYVGLAPIFLPRSCAGWFDTDVLNLLFPLVISFLYLYSYQTPVLKNRIYCVCASALLLGVFAFTWNFWFYILAILVIYEIFSSLNLLSEQLQYKTDNRSQLLAHALTALGFFAASAVCILFVAGAAPLHNLVGMITSALSLDKSVSSSIWPNVLTTVGELKKTDFAGFAKMTGGMPFFILAIISLLTMLLSNRRYSGIRREFIFLLVFWFMAMFLASFKGVRLLMFILVPLGIALGWGTQELITSVSRRFRRWVALPVVIAVVFFGSGFLMNSLRISRNLLPLMDDTWYSFLTTLKQGTPKAAVINSWWDFGDWFKAVSRRSVIFDGQSQSTPQAYWMARVLLSDSEEEAVAILRMLNNGGNKAYELIDASLKNQFASIQLLTSVLKMPESTARHLLEQRLPAEANAKVCDILFRRPGSAYFVVDASMIGKINPISYLGNWDFMKVFIAQNIKRMPAQKLQEKLLSLGLGKEQVARLYEEAVYFSEMSLDPWVSRRLSFYGVNIQGALKDNSVLFTNGFVYNLQEKNLYAYFPQEGLYRKPRSIFIASDAGVEYIPYQDKETEYSALLQENKGRYLLTLCPEELARSLFVKLYFLNGQGLKHFRPFTKEEAREGKLIAYEIVWD